MFILLWRAQITKFEGELILILNVTFVQRRGVILKNELPVGHECSDCEEAYEGRRISDVCELIKSDSMVSKVKSRWTQ